MTIEYNALETRIHLESIRNNYQLLRTRCPHPIPVIKADAYGHGLDRVAEILIDQGADILAAGTVEETARLRDLPFQGELLSLLGPLSRHESRLCWDKGIIPLVSSPDQMQELSDSGLAGQRLPIALKFDTGMSRLGFSEDQAQKALDLLESFSNLRLTMICSHLAAGDDPDAEDFVLTQDGSFQRICTLFQERGVAFRPCLANSAAILGYPRLHYELQRPGIALYGANPFWGTPWEEKGGGLLPAMEVAAPVVAVHDLKQGSTVSYGATYKAEKDMRVAVVAAGYADNYSRHLSNRGEILLQGKRAPILGRVCMQLVIVDVTDIPGVSRKERAILMGGKGEAAIIPEELASWWGTITYEVFCLLGQNRRTYID